MPGLEAFEGRWSLDVLYLDEADHRLGNSVVLRPTTAHKTVKTVGETDSGVEVVINRADRWGGAMGEVYRQEPPLHGVLHLAMLEDRTELYGVVTITEEPNAGPQSLDVVLVREPEQPSNG